MANPLIEKFWQDLIHDIRNNRITLPVLPEIALKARKMLNDPKVTTAQLAKVISADVALSTRLLKVVNSPLYRTRTQIDDVRATLTRLGNTTVRNLITSLAMEQLYHRRLSPTISTMLKNNWQHSLYVAALSHFIATNYTRLNADEALLSGLIHDIGALPILEYSEMLLDVAINEATLKKIVHTLHPKVGMLVLKTWNFSPALITVVAEHENLQRDPGTEVDYTDVVIVANLLSHIGTDHPYNNLDWTSVPAFSRLALSPEESIGAIKSAHEEIAETQRLFSN